MLGYHDASMAVGGVKRNDISVLNDNEYQENRPQREIDEAETSKAGQCLKKTAKFLFSHIGLVGLVVVYAAAGGFLFELLEQHQEKLYCQEAQGEDLAQVTKLKQDLVNYIKNNVTSPTPTTTTTTATYSMEKDNTTVAFAKIGTMLYSYRDFLIDLGSKYRFYGDDCSIINKWTYANSLLFAITIITTIGYGNITPVTWEGQICCICYATIGIPIFLLCVANISGVLGEMFRYIYSKVLCRPCHMIKRHRALARQAKLEAESGMDGNRVNNGGWTVDDNNIDNNNNNNKDSMKRTPNTIVNGTDVDGDEQQRNKRVTVPLTITMLIIALYIWIGSILFHNFEQWTMIQAGYFCFITLATIGFGDFVPGQRKDDPNATAKLILGAIYVLFGMAILAMCFDLMQEEIVAKFRWIGRKIGIIEKDESLVVNQNENITNNNRSPSAVSSTADRGSTKSVNGKMIDDEDENENGWSTQRSSSGKRKVSPRHNIARVHPIAITSNEGTLHQRAPVAKEN